MRLRASARRFSRSATVCAAANCGAKNGAACGTELSGAGREHKLRHGVDERVAEHRRGSRPLLPDAVLLVQATVLRRGSARARTVDFKN